jgi:hypothetical protein
MIYIDTVIMTTTDTVLTDMDLMEANDTVMDIMRDISLALLAQDIGAGISEQGFLRCLGELSEK